MRIMIRKIGVLAKYKPNNLIFMSVIVVPLINFNIVLGSSLRYFGVYQFYVPVTFAYFHLHIFMVLTIRNIFLVSKDAYLLHPSFNTQNYQN